MIYLQLFLAGAKIGTMTFGGGSSAVPLISRVFCHEKKWVPSEAFDDMVVLSSVLPGPTISQLVMLTSNYRAGFLGALCALLGLLLPMPMLLVIMLTYSRKSLDIETINKISLAIVPVVICILAIYVIGLAKKSVKNTGIIANVGIAIAAAILYLVVGLGTGTVFLIIIAGIVLYTLYARRGVK